MFSIRAKGPKAPEGLSLADELFAKATAVEQKVDADKEAATRAIHDPHYPDHAAISALARGGMKSTRS